MPRGSRVIVSSYELVDELCDESRFDKMLGPGLKALAEGPAGRGLVHRRLVGAGARPQCSIARVQYGRDARLFPPDARHRRPAHAKMGAAQSRRYGGCASRHDAYTLDTIALCGFNYRFNSFLPRVAPPFVVAMLGSRGVAGTSKGVAHPAQVASHSGLGELKADQLMLQTVQHIIQDRRAGAAGAVDDLLDRMLTGFDRQSGEELDDNNIIAQCITFLVAGHETTSGLLSFALYALLKNPKVLAQGYDEVDRVLGTDLSVLPTYAQIHDALRQPNSRRDAAVVAHSANLHAPPL